MFFSLNSFADLKSPSPSSFIFILRPSLSLSSLPLTYYSYSLKEPVFGPFLQNPHPELLEKPFWSKRYG